MATMLRTAAMLIGVLFAVFGLGAYHAQAAYASYETASAVDSAARYVSVEYEVANPTVYIASDDDLIQFELNRIGDRISFQKEAASAPVVYEQRCMADGEWRFVNISDSSDTFDPEDLGARLVNGDWKLGPNEATFEIGGATCSYTITVTQQDASKYSPITCKFDYADAALDSCDTGAVYYREEVDADEDSPFHLDGKGFAMDPYPATMASYHNYAYDIDYVGYRVNGGKLHELMIGPLGVYEVPPVSGPITIVVRSKQTAAVKNGVMSFPASKKLPNAYRLGIDLGKGMKSPGFVLRDPSSRDIVTIPSNSYLHNEIYLWPDCQNDLSFTFTSPKTARSLKLVPADAGEASFMFIDDTMFATITLNKPATLHIGTDGAILSAKPKNASIAYTGKALTPTIQVKTDSRSLRKGSEYAVSYADNVNAGTATATVKGINGYSGEKIVEFQITKAANKVKANANMRRIVQARTLAKKAAELPLPKATAKFGAVKWSIVKKDPKKVLSLKNGKIRVKKGTKAGVYTLKLAAEVPGTTNYSSASKAVSVSVSIR